VELVIEEVLEDEVELLVVGEVVDVEVEVVAETIRP